MKKNRPRSTAPTKPVPATSFALHPLTLAALLALAGPAAALPTGGNVVAGQATIQKPTTTQQIVTQTSQKAVIDWTTFSIASGETVRFDQPSSSAVLLNRVTGYDPSSIFGQMQSNGRIFLLNPYGVVFGASARVDVGGLVASSLSLSTADFMVGRFGLSSSGDANAPAQRGEVRNDGLINAPGGTVVLLGPQVTNNGTIDATGGRVGLAAAQEALVDVEGDGLIFFRTSGTEAGNRLAQLGRIQADGGSVELRAAARGAFADTVLNMGGVVQARGLGQRGGQIVIDGGEAGRTNIAGQIDATSAEARGGDVSVTGQRVTLQDGALVDASGATGGGTVRIGGGYQGHDTSIRNADVTAVGSGAVLRADATTQGDGGTVVVWADGRTLFAGQASVRAGAQGGNGGLVETSGKVDLVLGGRVDASAPKGQRGTWLIDPTNIDVANPADPIGPGNVDQFGDPNYSGTTPAPRRPGWSTISASDLQGGPANIVLQASNAIEFNSPLTVQDGGSLVARAGGDITVNAAISTPQPSSASILLSANDPSSPSTSNGRVVVAANITAGNTAGGTITITNNGSANPNQINGNRTLFGRTVTIEGATVLNGNLTVTAPDLAHFNGTVDGSGAGGQTLSTSAASQFDAAIGTTVALGSLTTGGATQLGGSVRTSGAQTYAGTVTLDGDATLTGTAVTLNGATTSLDAGAHSVAIEANTLTIAAAVDSDGTGTARLAAGGAATTLGVAGGAGTASLSQATLNKFSDFSSLTIGRSDGTGTVTVGALTLSQDTTLLAGAATIDFTGAITGGTNALSATTTGAGSTVLRAAATTTGLTSLTIDGAASIAAPSVDTSGAQTYNGAVTLTADTTLNAGSVVFGSTVGGAHALTINSATTTFGGAVGGGTALTSLDVSGTAQVDGGSVRTAAAQTYGGTVTLGADTVFTGSALNFDGAPVSLAAGAHDLELRTNALTLAGTATSSGAGAAMLAAAAAADTLGIASAAVTDASYSQAQLNALSSFGSLALGRSDGTGAVTVGAITLPLDTTIRALNAPIHLTGAVTGGSHALTLDTAGTTTIGATLGGLSTLTVTGAAQLNTAGVTTSGTQTYGGALTLGAATTLRGNAVHLNGAGTALAAGANDVTIETRDLAMVGAATGSGQVRLAGLGDADTIGVATTGSIVTIPQAALDAFGSFGTLRIGSASGTGAITVGAVTLPTDLVLLGDSAAVGFTGAIAGANHALTTTTGGTTTFGAAATTTNLGSLAVSGAGGTTVNGNITTNTTQTYAHTVTLGATSTFTGTAVAFDDAGVSLAAGTNGVAVQTRDLTLGGGVTSTGAGTARLGGFAAADTLGIATATVTDAAYTQAELDAFGGFGSLTLGRANGTGAVTLGAIALPLNTTVTAQNAPITFTGAITGNSRTLTATTSGPTTFDAAATFTGVNSLDVTQGATQLNGTVATTGAQHYAGNITLGAATTLNGSTLALGAAVNGAHALVLNPTVSASLGGAVSVASLDTNGATAINGGSVTTIGAQSYDGAVTLGANTTLSGASVAINAPLNAASDGGQSLTITAAGPTTLSGVGATNRLSTLRTNGGGTTTLGGNVSTTGAQTYDDTVMLGTTVTLAASSVAFNAAVDAQASGAQGLTVNANGATVFAAPVGATQALASLTTNAGGSTSIAGNVSATGAIAFGDAVTLAGDAVVSGGVGVAFDGSVNGAHALTVASPGLTRFGGTVGGTTPLTSLNTDFGGTTSLGGSVFTSGAQTYGDDLVLGATATLDAGSISLSNLNVGAFDLILQYDTSFTKTGSAAGSGFVSLAPRNAASTIGISGAPGLFQADLTQLAGLPNIGVGRPDGTGLISVGFLALPTNFKVQSGSGDIQFQTLVIGNGNALTASTNGTTSIFGPLLGLSTLALGGTTTPASGTSVLASGSISTTGAQVYSNAVTLSGPTTLSGSSVSFGSTVNGPFDLAVNSAGATVFGGAVGGVTALNSLTTDAGGTVSFAGGVRTVGAQSYGEAVHLAAGTSTLSGSSVVFGSTVDGSAPGASALVVDSAGTTQFGAAVGGNVALAALSTDALGTTQLAANVTTTGAQTYGDAVTLTGPVVLGAGSVSFGSTLDGAQSLAVNTSGTTTFGGPVGLFAPLASLTTDAGGSTVVTTLVRTSGALSFGDTLRLAGTTTLAGGSVTLSGAVDGTSAGAQALTVQSAGATVFGAGVGGTTALASLVTDAGGSTSLASNVAATGAVQFGDAVTLAGNAIVSGSSVNFAGTVDGNRTLAVNSAGLTRFGAAVGGTSALASLSTDAAGTLQLGSNVTTSGAQTYGEALTLTGNVTLAGASLNLQGTVDGPFALAANAAGATIFGGTVGGVTALASLSTDAGGTTTLPGTVTTSGAQSYGDTVALSANTLINGSAVSFGALNGSTFDLTTRTDAVAIAGAASGTGALSFAPRTAAGTIGVGDGAGTLQLSDALLSRLGSFASLTIGRVDGTGAITVGNTGLATDTAIVGASAPVGVSGTVAGNGHALAISTGGTTTLAGALNGLSTLTIANATVLNGVTVASGGNQSYGAGVTLAGDANLSGANLQFAGTVDGAHSLVVASTGTTTFGGGVGTTTALTSLAASGSTQVGSAVRTTGTQSYGAVALGTDTTFTGTDVSFGTLDGAHAATIAASGRTTFGGTVGAGAALTSLSVAGTSDFAGGSVRTTGAQSYAGDVTVSADTALDAASIGFGGRVNGNHALSATATGTTSFAGAVGDTAALASLNVAHAAQIGGGRLSTTGAQTYGGAVTLGTATAIDGASVAFASTLDGPGALSLTTPGAATFGAAVGGTTALAGMTVDAGSIQLAGNATTTGAQRWTAATTLAGNVALLAGGAVTLAGGIDSATATPRDLTVTGTSITLRGASGATQALGNLTLNGAIDLGASVTTAGTQSYNGATSLAANTLLSGPAVLFAGTVDGANALSIASADTRFAAAVGGTTALASLATDAAGTTRIAGNVTTSGTQHYGDALLLTGPSTLTGTTLTFDRTIDGAQALSVVGSGSTAIFNGAVGATTALASLNVSGPTQLNGGSITTTAGQTYAGTVTLGADTVLAANGVAITGALDGAHALTVQNAGTTTFGAAVGAGTALASLSVEGGGPTVLGGASVDTTGAQHYGGPVQAAGNLRLSGGSLAIDAGVAGAADLLLQADTLNTGGPIAGTGVLTIAPRSIDRSIGLAGAAGGLQVSQALLGSASGFSAHVIGRTDGSGDIAANALQLGADTTLQTGSGNLNLNGSVDGAFALALKSGGTTRLGGPIGTTTALRSLSTDNQPDAADWDGSAGERTLVDAVDGSGRARIVTTGAQTLDDPLIVTVPVQFAGSAVSATHAASRFDGTVHANAGTLDLRSAGAIVLGDVTLANGGRIETDGTLELAGALVLNAGTLSLVTNATPSSIDFTDPELQGRSLNFQLATLSEASATLFQSGGSTVSSAAGSLLVLRSPNGGSLSLENAGNDLRGGISAVSGTLGDNSVTRFSTLPLGFVRIASTEINAVGAPPADGSQSLLQAGIEGDVLKLTADKLTTGPTGQLRARLPFDNTQGSSTSVPAMTLIMSPTALTIGGGFGLATPDGYIQVRVGNEIGGFLTVRPRGASGENAFILLAGPDPKPFYDLSGKLTEVRVFYNGDAPRTPQESGALTAVMAIVEDARQTRFEEAVRTENVKSRLRSGVIAEVGAGRPATVGRESIRLPASCNPKETTLQCE